MSQLMVCKNSNGIVLAADSKAVDFEPDGTMVDIKTDRLIQLGNNAAVLTGGDAEGAQMCMALRNFCQEEGLSDILDIYSAAMPFLATEYEKFMRKKCEVMPLDPIHQVYFILAGYTAKDPGLPFRMYMMWTKKKLPQLDGDEIGSAYTVPRRMGLEYKLNQMSKADAPLDEIITLIKEHMELLGERQEEVGPPFTYAFITKEGFQKID